MSIRCRNSAATSTTSTGSTIQVRHHASSMPPRSSPSIGTTTELSTDLGGGLRPIWHEAPGTPQSAARLQRGTDVNERGPAGADTTPVRSSRTKVALRHVCSASGK